MNNDLTKVITKALKTLGIDSIDAEKLLKYLEKEGISVSNDDNPVKLKPNVKRAFDRIASAALMYDLAGVLYLSMGQEAERLGELVPAKFSLAQSMVQLAVAAKIRADAELQIANIGNLEEAVSAAIKQCFDGLFETEDLTDQGGKG
jgi:hypothetical protein